MSETSGVALVTGGSRGLGRGIVEALAAKMRVVALAREGGRLASLAKEIGVETFSADVADASACGRILQEVQPDLLVLCAGAAPLLRPIHQQTWETFSENWNVDTKSTFNWVRDALLLPMKSGSHVVVVSSGAALRGSPVSGGYASAKRAQWFIADYAAKESERLKLGIRFQCVLPALNPNTELGRPAVAAYAQREGITQEAFLERFGTLLTPAIAGKAILELHEDPSKWNQLAYQLGGGGLTSV
jgi:NAD(P)-dependent dehydrogenase (short-subunit alcohol dehydrogenase family)